jgi:hypothetical protein
MYKLIPETKNRKRMTYWGVFFGIFPDILAFTPLWIYIFYNAFIRHQGFRFLSPEDNAPAFPLDRLTHGLYNISHSLVIWGVVFAVTWVLIKRVPWVLLGWALHICIDIFSHNSRFYPTPFLFPISNFHINGYPWSETKFMIINYGALLILYLFIIPKLIKKSN